jgi:hypothetical protein
MKIPDSYLHILYLGVLKGPGFNSQSQQKNLHFYFDCKYFNGLLSGVLVLTQH